MVKRVVDREHLMIVASMRCVVCKNTPVQCHHLLQPYSGPRGISLRSGDNNVIPLCYEHHAELHTKFGNEKKFFKHYFEDEDYGKKKAKELYEQTLYERENPDDLPF